MPSPLLDIISTVTFENVCRVHTKRQDHNQNVQVQHVYHCLLYLIFDQIEMAQEQKYLRNNHIIK